MCIRDRIQQCDGHPGWNILVQDDPIIDELHEAGYVSAKRRGPLCTTYVTVSARGVNYFADKEEHFRLGEDLEKPKQEEDTPKKGAASKVASIAGTFVGAAIKELSE